MPDGAHYPLPPATRPVHPSAGSRMPASARDVTNATAAHDPDSSLADGALRTPGAGCMGRRIAGARGRDQDRSRRSQPCATNSATPWRLTESGPSSGIRWTIMATYPRAPRMCSGVLIQVGSGSQSSRAALKTTRSGFRSTSAVRRSSSAPGETISARVRRMSSKEREERISGRSLPN